MCCCKPAVDIDEEVDRPPAAAIDRRQIAGQARRERVGPQKRLELAQLRRLVGERELFGVRLEKEVERIVDGHFGHQVHLDAELVDLSGNVEARDVVALRILLPVQKVAGWRDAL